MTIDALSPQDALFKMITGYQISCAIHVAATLGLADHLARGPRHVRDLAQATKTHGPSLRRILRLLASAGVLAEEDDEKFSTTPIGACLQADDPDSMRPIALLLAGSMSRQAWGKLQYTVETGQPAFTRVFGRDPFSSLPKNPNDVINEELEAYISRSGKSMTAVYDFSQFGSIVDVGGGNGVLLSVILEATPSLRGVLFDLPHVVEPAKQRLDDLGLTNRCEVVGGDYFDEMPSGYDAYILWDLLSDWDDNRSKTILNNCRVSMKPTGKLLIVEGVYPARIDRSDECQTAASMDVNAMVCTGGRIRTEVELRTLCKSAGLRLATITPTSSQSCLIEAVRD